jgi:hypothetical protein
MIQQRPQHEISCNGVRAEPCHVDTITIHEGPTIRQCQERSYQAREHYCKGQCWLIVCLENINTKVTYLALQNDARILA